jgi:gluconokinase
LHPVKPSISKNELKPVTIITLMGVSGCGKTTIGKSLARALGWEFVEGDTFHPQVNIEKMASGVPLTDADRLPWLQSLHAVLRNKHVENTPVVLACSALKVAYRNILSNGLSNYAFVFLKGNYALILERMRQRNHFMKPSLLQSQFKALQEPDDALVIPISIPIDQVVIRILRFYKLQGHNLPK